MKNNNKNIHFLAIAALAATLMAGQIQISPVYAENTSVQLSSLIPDNVTVEQPMPLSDISLPDSEYGTLSWVDSSSVPSERVQSYEVVFRPYDISVLSQISGWDGESDAIYSSVTVVVSSLESDSEESYEQKEDSDMKSDENYDNSETENDENQDNYDENQNSSESKEDKNTEDDGQASEKTPEEKTEDPEVTEIPSEDTKEEAEITEKPSEENKDTKEDESGAETVKKSEDNGENTKEIPTAAPEVTSAPEATEIPEATDTPEITETPAVTVTPAADKNNIFDGTDKDIKEDDRSTEFEENLTDEQKAEMADENHSCNGITVSGIDLPYYVQFRVASGDDYEFTNESEANVFQSYEFELWDLKNNTEYQVPDGEYVSVTVPVKAGYSYTIEHLLDSGAMETIVPSVDGSTMVFSTHSFSPFGIAGSKTLVGEEIEEDGYDTGVVTETPDSVESADLTPVADNSTSSSDNTTTTTVSSDTDSSADNGAETDTSELTGASAETTTQSSGNTSGDAQNDEGNSSSSVKAVHTNDPTRILPFVILAIAAGAIVGVIVYLRKRKK